MDQFKGKVLLLTGASGGIGGATARRFYDDGANLALAGRSVDALDDFVAGAGFDRHRVCVIGTDASRDGFSGAAARAVDGALERFNTIDFVVACAGVFQGRLGDGLSDEDWSETLGVNVQAVASLITAAVPHLGQEGAAVAISSIGGQRGMAEFPHYAASKAAVVGLTKSLALAYAPNVRVNAIAPGLIETAMSGRFRATKAGQRSLAMIPAQRIGQPEEIAGVVRFLCSSDASYITGQTLHVNGGLALVG